MPTGIATTPRAWRRYAALGDSFSEGLCDELRPDGRHRGWADRLAELLARAAEADRAAGPQPVEGFAYANLAVRGRLVGQVVAEQVPLARRLSPDLVSMAVGVNDALRPRFDLDATATALEAGVRALRADRSDVLLVAFGDPARRSVVMARVRDRIQAYNSAVEAIAVQYGCYLVRFWDVAAMDDDALWAEDRLHLSPEGHRLAADCALEALGLGDDLWRTPPIPGPRPSLALRAGANVRWARAHLAPWVGRRLRGESSGDGVPAKHPDWVAVSGRSTTAG